MSNPKQIHNERLSRSANPNTTTKQRPIPLSFGKISLKQRLEDYYSLIAPDAISNENEWKRKFELIHDKYGGSEKGEKQLAQKLAKKYGTIVRFKLAVNAADSNANNNTTSGSTKGDSKTTGTSRAQHEESWYELLPHERNSANVDFTSQQFDPEAVLSLPRDKIIETNPFVQHVPLLDNISKFVPILPDCDPLKRKNNNKRKHYSEDNNTTTSIQSNAVKKQRKQSLLTQIAATYEHSGPLSLLHSIYMKRQRVRVMIRYVDCIRGTLTGYLLAFDKHMNMILRDVDEVYTTTPVTRIFKDMDLSKAELEHKRRTCIVASSYNDSHENLVSSSFFEQKDNNHPLIRVKERNSQQLLVRGDNVVMVWRAGSERSKWPRTVLSPEKSIYETSSSDQYRNDIINDGKIVGTPGSLSLLLQKQQRANQSKGTTTKGYKKST
mmetsp:Transcript_1119/g.1354  ORF Transcript_1119/g.1354 Transcript_1119/m.1354 type:complete len:438 (-) Transcript_1119:761-2074(-)